MVSVTIIGAVALIAIPLLVKLFYYLKQGKNKYFPDMQKKVVLVTGGNAGIGKETARLLYQLNATVIITGRSKAKAQEFLEELPMHTPKRPKMKFYQVDFSDLENVKKFADEIKAKYKKIDILVNNAGMFSYKHELSKQGIEMTMAVNHLAPVYLTSLLMDLLVDQGEGRRQTRVVNVASCVHIDFKKQFTPFLEAKEIWNTEIGKHTKGALKFDMLALYGLSKFSNIAFSRGLAKVIEAKKWSMKTASLHPGVIFTGLWRFMDDIAIIKHLLKPIVVVVLKFFMRTEKEGAATTQHLCLCPYQEIVNGEYYDDCRVASHVDKENLEKYTGFIWDETIKVIFEKTGHRCFGEKAD